ncbi:TPA: hypothetical protein RQK43_004423 [Vibrio vulnificus]|uniref:hypothetical protein n=1 Tax=Vibrio vulnificus TaxID=672 RepID=UPI0019D48322|nr:hypothetical protein [Vibrio vulnificus]MBN8147660.1 hypothetical protein [Vibrio vulnificus]HAS6163763.1 hypothetical protein [Vibrio vulnificus]HDY7864621.1 hypothetical protein [Vibrio vulnificus]HDY7878484.1 hypothetical protein [Vibrio vulnificus]
MNINEKEIALLESSLDKVESGKLKLDSMSASLLISSILLFVTSSPGSSIKLAFLGIELKSIYAVYMLYLFSLISAGNCMTLHVKKALLFSRYKIVLRELYGEIPKSLYLVDSSDYEIRKTIFQGRWRIINHLFHCLTTLPFLISYFVMGKVLVSFVNQPKFIQICSFLILIFGLYLLPLLFRSIYISWKTKSSSDYQAVQSEG